MIRFAYTIFYVKHVRATLRFYHDAFGFRERFIAPDETYGELDTGDTTLSFAQEKLADSNLPDGYIASNPAKKPFAMEVGFTTNDVAGTLKKAVKAGAVVVAKPKTKPWGQVVAYVRDPEGFLIEICTPVA